MPKSRISRLDDKVQRGPEGPRGTPSPGAMGVGRDGSCRPVDVPMGPEILPLRFRCLYMIFHSLHMRGKNLLSLEIIRRGDLQVDVPLQAADVTVSRSLDPPS